MAVAENLSSWKIISALSYALVLWVIGLPIWWETTKLDRVALPNDRMIQLDERPLQIAVNTFVYSSDSSYRKLIASEITKYFTNPTSLAKNSYNPLANKDVYFKVHVHEVKGIIEPGPGEVLLLHDDQSLHTVHVTHDRIIRFNKNATSSKLHRIVKNWMLNDDTIKNMVANMKAPGSAPVDTVMRRRVPAALTYDLMLTLINSDPEKTAIKWNLKDSTKKYLQPFLTSLGAHANFKLKTQWLYYMDLEGNRPQLTNRGDKVFWVLNDKQLPYLITTFEKKLSSHTAQNPSLNFVVYTTHCDEAPLYIETAGELHTAFFSPRWGGVVLLNPDCSNNSTSRQQAVARPNMKFIYSNFITQLRYLMGISPVDTIEEVYLEPLTTIEPRVWEKDNILRLKTVEQAMSARLTLKSLNQLLTEIKTIVINKHVGQAIHTAVDMVEKTEYHLARGELLDAFYASNKAFNSSEFAFTDPSLLALLYFPDDQKYAVYIPLFLPVMIPVVLSMHTVKKYLFNLIKSKKGVDEKKEN